MITIIMIIVATISSLGPEARNQVKRDRWSARLAPTSLTVT